MAIHHRRRAAIKGYARTNRAFEKAEVRTRSVLLATALADRAARARQVIADATLALSSLTGRYGLSGGPSVDAERGRISAARVVLMHLGEEA